MWWKYCHPNKYLLKDIIQIKLHLEISWHKALKCFFAVVIDIWCAAALSCGDKRKTKLQLQPLFPLENHVLQWGKCSAYLLVYLTSHVFGGLLVGNIKKDIIQTSALSCTNTSFINDILAWGRNHNKAIYKWSQYP